MNESISQEHHEIKVTLGKIETQLEHISKQLDVIHNRIDDRETEIKVVEALARSNDNRLTALESEINAYKWWIAAAFAGASSIGAILAVVFR